MVKTALMKNNLIKIVLLFFAFNGLMNVIYPQIVRKIEIRSSYFGYVNFKKTHILLPDTVLKYLPKNITTEKTFIQGIFFDKKLKVKSFSDSLDFGKSFFLTEIETFEMTIIPEDFVNFLCDNGLVSIAWDYRTDYWKPQIIKNEDTIIQHFKEINEFWFLGKILINPDFDSYLFLAKESDTSGLACLRSIFLLNVKDNIINSLVQIAYKQIFEGEGPFFFTKASSQGRYCYYGKYYSTFFIVNKFGKRINEPKEEKYVYYSFDDNGYVQLHELKGKKKFIINKYKHRLFENIR